MKVSTLLYGIAAAAGLVSGQSTNTKYVEPNTGIEFAVARFDATSAPPGGFTWGYVLPPAALTSPGTEYLGYLVGTHTGGKAYAGISHYSSMPNGLLLVAWPNGNDVLTSFRWASGWVVPEIYTGNATLTQIWHNVNSTHFSLVYRCQNCWAWNQNGAAQSNPTNSDYQGLAWAQAATAPDPQNDPNGQVLQHERQGNFAGQPSSAAHSSYSVWASKATAVPVTTTKTTTSATATATATVSGLPAPTGTWDYIVVGGGAGGITVADKLSEAGKKVLLVEIGPASYGRTGGTMGPAWIKPQNLTRFDVPGLDNEIWVDPVPVACKGIDQMAGCVLGGGTAVNAGLWWKPPAIDWNYNFPAGWKSTDMAPATQRVFSRIPGTDHPSMDGKVYLPQGYDLIGGALAKAGWANVTANNVPDQKNRTFTRGPFMYRGGQRDGPAVTYLQTSLKRSNFKLLLNTGVRRLIRTNGHVTGVELQAMASGGSTGIVNVTATTGRVILSAGTFNTAKILFRSGIGPTDMLNIVKGSAIDGATMIASSQWINLPVGSNLDDHTNTDLVIRHPSVVFYDFYEAYNTPNPTDRDLYLNKRSGILAQSAPNIGPLFHESIYGADGVTRQLQWTARVEGSLGEDNNNTMTLSQYLGRGAKSRGRTTINGALNMEVPQSGWPYLKDKNDVEAVITGIDNLLKILKTIPNLTVLHPMANQTTREFVNAYDLSPGSRRANHWIGSAKMGTDDGRSGGTAVVDLNTKVYGTDNLFVVDASIFPGMVTTNPSAPIVIAAERAAERILALKTTAASAQYAQCGGQTFNGAYVCAAPYTCTYSNEYYSQCL